MTLLFPHRLPKKAMPAGGPAPPWVLLTHISCRKEKALKGAGFPVCTDQKPSSRVSKSEWHHGTNLFTFVTTLQITFVIWVSFPDQPMLPLGRSLSNPLGQPPNHATLTSRIKSLSSSRHISLSSGKFLNSSVSQFPV